VAKTKTIHSDEILSQKLNLRQGELINEKGKTETVLAEKVTFNPHMTSWREADREKGYEGKKIIPQNTKKKLKKY
jgi:type I restriction-modification system DNA methylase subunit